MILVTGGTGLVGAHLLYNLVSAGELPVALVRKSSNLLKTKKVFSYYTNDVDSLFNKIVWVYGDILDYDAVSDAMHNVNTVYHTAAMVSFTSGDKDKLMATNVVGTANIVNAALSNNITKLLHVSTIGTLGRAESNLPVTENTYWNSKKSSIYSTSKYRAEMEVWRGIAEGLNAVIINPSIILGPGNWNTGSSKLTSTVYKGLKFYSTGTNGFVSVEDVVKSMVLLMNGDISGERYIVNSENISYKQLFTWMANSLNVKAPKYKAGKILGEIVWRLLWVKGFVTGKKSAITRETAVTANQLYSYSNNKIKQEIGIEFKSVADSIERYSKFFLLDNNK
jgi:nucleoside-diphosphate-sugar epimerase